MLPIPFRAKNPPEHFPYVTIGLIVANSLIFLLTSENFLHVSPEAVRDFAVTHNNLNLWRLLTAMFLHGNWEHLGGNMLFLWIFGASVEGRLRPAKFLVVYLVAGMSGGLLEDVLWGVLSPDTPSLGASGAIMGLAGAYLYMFTFSTISVFYILPLGFYFRIGTAEWQARWVVLMYVGMDVLLAFLVKGGDGVGHLAHLGGLGTGLLMVAVMKTKRDTLAVSEVQAVRAEVKDYTLLSVSELETLLQQPTEDNELVLAYLEKAVGAYGSERTAYCLNLLNFYGQRMVGAVNPERLAYVMLRIPIEAGGLPPVYYLRVASRLEAVHSNDLASQCYRRIYDIAPQAPETEVALFRLGQLMQNIFQNNAHAHAIYSEMLRLFPHGEMSIQARRSLQQIG